MNYAHLDPHFMNKTAWNCILDAFEISQEDRQKIDFIEVPVDACDIFYKEEEENNNDL